MWKSRVRLFRSKKKLAEKDNDSDSYGWDYKDSQVTVLEKIYDLEEDIKSMSSDLKTVCEKKRFQAGENLSIN